jgi:hypothetical protein
MIVDNGKYYLYRHIRLDTKEPFYIGIGTKRGKVNTDIISAYYRAFTTDSRNNFWQKVVKKSGYEVDILLESNDKCFILNKEKEFVDMYGRRDLGNGSLVNLVDGGKNPTNPSKYSIKKTLSTKRKRGNLSNAKNLIEWMNSPDYKNARARYLYVYSISGDFIKKYNSVQSFADFIGLKGSVSFLLKKCNTRQSYKGAYILSWVDEGNKISIDKYSSDKTQNKSVYKICPLTKNVLGKYNKITDAAIENDATLKNISEAIINKGRCNGFYWIYETELHNIDTIKFTKPSRPVFGVNKKGEVVEYFAANIAEKHFGLSKGSICNAVKYKYRCKGYLWEYMSNKQKQAE